VITHVVLFKLNEPKEQSAEAVHKALRPLGDGRVPSVLGYDLGGNVGPLPGAWDLALVATMTDLDGLNAYLAHPDHVAAAGSLGAFVADAAMIDFETDVTA
jgi:Stress responsive A/B Barrel Domain